jgi:2'-5' RNA ligase
MALVRCFIAIELPDELIKELAVLIAGLKNRSPSIVRWVDPKGIHITLKFLGEVSEELIDEIVLSMEETASSNRPFKLQVGGVGAFPNLNRPQLAWVGVKGEMDKLNTLQKKIEQNIEQLGFPREKRDYSPHLTLGRVRNEAPDFDRQKLGKLLSTTTFASNVPVDVEAVHLFKSQLTPAGAIYTVMKTSRLTGV